MYQPVNWPGKLLYQVLPVPMLNVTVPPFSKTKVCEFVGLDVKST